MCALINKMLGTTIAPWDVAQWPMETVDIIIGLANAGMPPTDDDTDEDE